MDANGRESDPANSTTVDVWAERRAWRRGCRITGKADGRRDRRLRDTPMSLSEIWPG